MSELLPFRYLDQKTRSDFHGNAKDIAAERLMKLVGWLHRYEIDFCDLGPADFGLQGGDWLTPPLKKGMTSTYIDYMMENVDEIQVDSVGARVISVIIINGVAFEDTNPAVTQLSFSAGGDSTVIETQKLYAAPVWPSHFTVDFNPDRLCSIPMMEAFFRPCVLCEPGTKITVKVKSRADKPDGEHVILTGIKARWVCKT